MEDVLKNAVQVSYLIAAFLFIYGLKRMSSPKTARSGIVVAGVGMLVACLATFLFPEIMHGGIGRILLIASAALLGTVIAWVWGKKVAMTDMPQMVAIYNGMGGGAAAAIAAVELLRMSADGDYAAAHGKVLLGLAVFGGLIGAISLTGSVVAWAKLDGRLNKTYRLPMHHILNLLIFLGSVAVGVALVAHEVSVPLTIAFFVGALVFGVMMTLPIGGADMPVVISLYNAFTGLAVSFEGVAMNNPAMIIAGMVVGAAGTLLTLLMAKAMNRSVSNVLFSGFGTTEQEAGDGPTGTMKESDPNDAAALMAFATKVIIIPGYGMAVAQAQHKLWEMVKLLRERGVDVKFAIHPVAGRMPGHMNVLLAEASVPYDVIYDLEDINEEFATADVSLVIGANDVVNPAARTNKSSPIYGMPILNADYSQNVLVIKRGKGTGFSGIENELFFKDNTRLVYGSAQDVCAKIVSGLKELQ